MEVLMIERMPILKNQTGDKYYFGINDTQMIEIDVCPNFDTSQVSVKIVENKINELVQTGKVKLMDVVTPQSIEKYGINEPALNRLADEIFSPPYMEQE
jgi:hypothetical protein